MYAQTNRSLHHNGWSTSSQTDLKADQLSSKASRGFHCKLMRCLLQCPCLSTDRALINQGNHKEIWERLCSKSPWDHKCTASKIVRPHYPSSLRFVLFVFLLLFFFLLFFFLAPSTSLHRLPCRHGFHRHFKIARVLICTVTLNVHRFFFLDDCAKLEWNKWNTATVKSFTERGGECAVVAALHSHLLDLPFHYDAVVDTTDLINPLLMHAVEIHLKFSAFDSSVRRSGPPPCSIQGPTSKPVSCKHAQNGIQTQDNSADRNHHPALIEQDATFLGLAQHWLFFCCFFKLGLDQIGWIPPD